MNSKCQKHNHTKFTEKEFHFQSNPNKNHECKQKKYFRTSTLPDQKWPKSTYKNKDTHTDNKQSDRKKKILKS